MLKIVNFIKENGLAKAITAFNLKSKIYDSKILLKYDQLSSPSIMALEEVQECRGLILEKDTWNVMSMAFKKFFNSEETNAHKIDWNTALILEKVDGSCISVYYDWNKSEWFAATTGVAEGEGEVNNKNGTTFNKLFWDTLKNKYNLDKTNFIAGFTYVFELTTPYNIVVKPHSESSVTLLTIRNLKTLEELSFEEVNKMATSMNLPHVKSYDLNSKNVGALLKTFIGMPWSEEGYVVVDSNFNRIKIKNPAYISVHHLKGKTAEHNILTIVKSNEIEEFSATFPERKEELFKLKENYDILLNKLNKVWLELQEFRPKNISPSEKKKYAESVFKITNDNEVSMFTGLFFGLNDGKVKSVEDFLFNYDDKKLYKIL